MTGTETRPDWMGPGGRARVSTFVVVPGAERVMDFAQAVFDARLIGAPLYRADGALWNAEINIGDSTIMLGEARDGLERPGFLYVHVPDALATYARALEHGAAPIMAPEERFYGAIDGGVQDMAGNWWWIATQVKALSDDEIEAGARTQEARQ